MKNKVLELIKQLKELYIRFQAVPLIGAILFVIYMIFKVTTCWTMGVCVPF